MSDKPVKPVPKTVALGLTKTTLDGRVISINHPNPTGMARLKRPYRSLKAKRSNLLPNTYTPRDRHPQNGEWNCPVEGCGSSFTRKAGLLNHMTRESGHAGDKLRDKGDGTFAKDRGNDMRIGHLEPKVPKQSYEAMPSDNASLPPNGASVEAEDGWLAGSQSRGMENPFLADEGEDEQEFKNALDWAVSIALQEYETAKTEGLN